jgi:hypothetical protein
VGRGGDEACDAGKIGEGKRPVREREGSGIDAKNLSCWM